MSAGRFLVCLSQRLCFFSLRFAPTEMYVRKIPGLFSSFTTQVPDILSVVGLSAAVFVMACLESLFLLRPQRSFFRISSVFSPYVSSFLLLSRCSYPPKRWQDSVLLRHESRPFFSSPPTADALTSLCGFFCQASTPLLDSLWVSLFF